MTVDLVKFLRDRLDEDELVALGCIPVSEQAALRKGIPLNRWKADGSLITEGVVAQVGQTSPGVAAHITRHDPARTLAEVDAKRRIIDECESAYHHDSWGMSSMADAILGLLALPHREHPDYKQE